MGGTVPGRGMEGVVDGCDRWLPCVDQWLVSP